MSFLSSLRDTTLVARFWLRRAVRTRSAVGLCLVYTLVATGSAWIFTRILQELERSVAKTLMVPETKKPGAMMDVMRQQEEMMEILGALLPDRALLDWALELPYLTVSHFWICMATVPFLAAAAGSETLAAHVRDRSVRYEVARTGRLELMAGRFLGQALLVFLATLLSILGTWTVAMTAMTGQPPVEQLTSLLALTPRICVWSLPFLGVGVACSSLVSSQNGARVLALGATVASWLVWGLLGWERLAWLGVGLDVIAQVLPQNYVLGLWGPGAGWATSAVALVGLGLVVVFAAWPLFQRRRL